MVCTVLAIVENKAEMIKNMDGLKVKGFEVVGVTNGLDAMVRASKYKPDVIFINIEYPEGESLQTAISIKNNTAISHIPIVISVDMNNKKELDAVLEQKVEAIVPRPINFYITSRIINDLKNLGNMQGKKALLLVDDDKSVIDALGYAFRAEGYNVFLAEDGTEAFEKARSLRPDLIIMDYLMPNGNGLEAVKKIREVPFLSNVAIIGHTGVVNKDIVSRSAEHGCDMLLRKPIPLNEFFAKVKALIASKTQK